MFWQAVCFKTVDSKNVCGSTIDSIVLRIDSISPMFESIAIYWSIESILWTIESIVEMHTTPF